MDTVFKDLIADCDLGPFLKEKGFKTATDVQREAIPQMMAGKSISVLARTGSGKTMAFALPIMKLLKLRENDGHFNEQNGAPLAIILAPTRELARQIFREFKSICHHVKLRIRVVEGGDSERNRALRTAPIDVLIGVPGRMSSMITRKEISLDSAEFLVMDEADQLLDMGFMKDIKNIVKRSPADIQVALFSATMPDDYIEFKKEMFEKNVFIDICLQDSHSLQSNIDTFNIKVKAEEKETITDQFVKKEAKGKGIIFVNTKEKVDQLLKFLEKQFPDKSFFGLHGGLNAVQRRNAYQSFLDKNSILICTDISARGIDIGDLCWILNYDLPFEAVYYIHRCGRIGRNGKTGIVYNLVSSIDEAIIARINLAIKMQSSLKLEMIKQGGRGQSSQKKSTDKNKKGKIKKKMKQKPRYSRR